MTPRSPRVRRSSKKRRAGSRWSRGASRIWIRSRRPTALLRSMASCSTSAFRPCRSTRRRADFPSGSTDRSTCAWGATARARPMSSRRASERDLASIIATLGEERHARTIARAIVKTREAAGDRYDARARRHRRAYRARERRHDPPGHPHFPGAADFRQRRACRIGAWPRRRRARAQACRASRRRRLPLARRSHRQDLPRRAQPRAGVLPPSAADCVGAADLPRADAAAGNAGRRRDRGQPARPFGEAPRRRTYRCRCARSATIETLLPRLPSLADVMRGRA